MAWLLAVSCIKLPKWPAWLVGLVHHEHPIFGGSWLRVQTLPEHGSVSSPTSTGLLRGLMTCGADLKIRLHSSQAMDVNGQGSWYHGRIGRVPSARSHVTEIVWRQSLISWAEDGWSPGEVERQAYVHAKILSWSRGSKNWQEMYMRYTKCGNKKCNHKQISLAHRYQQAVQHWDCPLSFVLTDLCALHMLTR